MEGVESMVVLILPFIDRLGLLSMILLGKLFYFLSYKNDLSRGREGAIF